MYLSLSNGTYWTWTSCFLWLRWTSVRETTSLGDLRIWFTAWSFLALDIFLPKKIMFLPLCPSILHHYFIKTTIHGGIASRIEEKSIFEGDPYSLGHTHWMEVSWNNATPQSSILIGFSIQPCSYWGSLNLNPIPTDIYPQKGCEDDSPVKIQYVQGRALDLLEGESMLNYRISKFTWIIGGKGELPHRYGHVLVVAA